MNLIKDKGRVTGRFSRIPLEAYLLREYELKKWLLQNYQKWHRRMVP